jgi:hypothetical protein
VYLAPPEKYDIALGQSPEAIALMKTDPLRLGSKVSKIKSPQKVGTNFLLEFGAEPLISPPKFFEPNHNGEMR